LAYVETQSLSKRYGRTLALCGCTLAVEQGEVFGLLGPNGAGKTTLLRLLLGMLRPTEGTATIDGLDCYRQSLEVHRRLSYLPGEARLFRNWRGGDVLRFYSEIRGSRDFERPTALARRLDLDLTRTVATMSTGTRQKLALVAALAADTPLVILDEPTSSLDPTVRAEVVALVKEARQAGRTVIFSSHVLAEADEACDRVAIVRAGRLAHTQVMRDLRSRHRIRARLTGPLVPAPAAIQDRLTAHVDESGQLTIETLGDLSPLLGWLATLPLVDTHVAPIGLRDIYERVHPSSALV
jgi:ABC-2 type transport system ATP-binding protein